MITIRREKYIVGEALFQPSILGLEEYGIIEQLVRCISSVSSENHRQLLENTVLCGGTMAMTGMFLFLCLYLLSFDRKAKQHCDQLSNCLEYTYCLCLVWFIFRFHWYLVQSNSNF